MLKTLETENEDSWLVELEPIEEKEVVEEKEIFIKYNTLQIEPIPEKDFETIMTNIQPYLKDLRIIVQEFLSGSTDGIIYEYQTFRENAYLQNKQRNIATIATKSRKIIQVGSNIGHAVLVCMIANPNAEIHCYSYSNCEYTKRCYEYLAKTFPKLKLCTIDKLESDCADLYLCDPSFAIKNGKNGSFVITENSEDYNKNLEDKKLDLVEILPVYYKEHYIGKVNKPNIAVLSLALGSEYKKIVKFGVMSKQVYCGENYYDFIDDESVYDSSRPYAWSKVRLILKYLAKYSYVVWIDSDTYILNMKKKLEDFIGRLMDNKDIMVSHCPAMINTGVIFVRNCEHSFEFFNRLYEKEEFINDNNWEQSAFIDMYNKNELGCKEYIKVLPQDQQREFNSYYSQYRYGDFLIHCAGTFRDNKDYGLAEMMSNVNPFRCTEDTDETYAKRLDFIDGLNVRFVPVFD